MGGRQSSSILRTFLICLYARSWHRLAGNDGIVPYFCPNRICPRGSFGTTAPTDVQRRVGGRRRLLNLGPHGKSSCDYAESFGQEKMQNQGSGWHVQSWQRLLHVVCSAVSRQLSTNTAILSSGWQAQSPIVPSAAVLVRRGADVANKIKP